jgi:hypothetical protein
VRVKINNKVPDPNFEPMILIGALKKDDDGNWLDWDGDFCEDTESRNESYGVASAVFVHENRVADESVPAGVGPGITSVTAVEDGTSGSEIENEAVILIPTEGVGAIIELSGSNFDRAEVSS